MDQKADCCWQNQSSMNEIRKTRIKEFSQKATKIAESMGRQELEQQPNQIKVERSQCDDAKFILKYFDTVNSKQYKQFFCKYNENMFAQVSWARDLTIAFSSCCSNAILN